MTDSPLVRVLTAHWLAGVDCDHATRQDRARCACSRVDFGWQPSIGTAVQTWIAHVVTLLTIETQAELARQLAGSGGQRLPAAPAPGPHRRRPRLPGAAGRGLAAGWPR